MDCERFDRIVLDFLYDELDELTAAAARRHIEHCSRCRGIVAGLRATREVGALPLVDPPDGLELRILEAEQQVRGRLSFRQRAGRTISVLAGYAMRPQLAMAALLLLAIGGGLFMFRQRPNDRDTVSVTERGVAESDPEPATVLPKAAPEPSAVARAAAPTSPSGTRDDSPPLAARPAALGGSDARDGEDSVFHAALAAFRAGRYKEARQQFESVVAQGGHDAPQAAYYAAQSAKSAEGCGVGAPLFDQVSQRYPGTRAGYDGTWEAASCYQAMGDTEKARRAYQALLDEPTYGTRARSALAELDRIDDPQAYAARKSAASAPAKKTKQAPLDGDASTESSPPAATTSAPAPPPPAMRPMPAAPPQAPALPPAE